MPSTTQGVEPGAGDTGRQEPRLPGDDDAVSVPSHDQGRDLERSQPVPAVEAPS